MRKILLPAACVFLLWSCAGLPSGTGPEYAPLDPAVKTGILSNGLKYYILQNAKPAKRAHLRLVVDAGSVQETERQRGLAHLLEHMAFNGTKNFQKQEIVDYFEKIGMKFGDNLNAYTSFSETVYKLDIPTDTPEVIRTSFQILEDWAHNLTLDPQGLESEKGVVEEEWRLGRNVQGRRRDFQVPLLFQGSAYADRLPIGSMEVVRNATAEDLRRFYEDWYQPRNMAIVAVGDFDPVLIEELVKAHFGYPGKAAKPRAEDRIPPYQERTIHVFADPELTFNAISLNRLERHPLDVLEPGLRMGILESLVGNIVNKRLEEITQKADAPFLGGFVDGSWYARGHYLRSLYVMPQEGGFDKALESFILELRRMRSFGATESEFKRELEAYQSDLEQNYLQRAEIEHDDQVEGLQKYFLENRPFPGPEVLYQVRKKILGSLTRAEVNAYASQALDDSSSLVLVSAIDRPGLTLPKPDVLAEVLVKAEAASIEAPVEKKIGVLMTQKPEPGVIAQRTEMPFIDVQIWELANGAKVFLKKTDFRANEVIFSALSPGGTNTVPDKDWVSADFAINFFQESGLGALSESELQDFLAPKQVKLTLDMNTVSETMNGSAAPQDLETLFQLIHLRMAAPRKDEEAFRASFRRYEDHLKNRLQSPDTAFQDEIQSVLSQNDFRSRPSSPALLKEFDYGRSYRIFEDKFGAAGDFLFSFVGDFEWDHMRALVQLYLASLPRGPKESVVDRGVRPPRGLVEREVKKGVEPRALQTLFLTGVRPFQFEDILMADALEEILDISLREEIREALGGTYDISVSVSLGKYPYENYQVAIYFGCDPSRRAMLVEEVKKVLAKVARGDFQESLLDKFKEGRRRSLETERKTNQYWATRLVGYSFYGNDYHKLVEMDQIVDSISKEDVVALAGQFLSLENVAEIVLLPQP